MADTWLSYSNQGATRSQPIAPDLIEALSFLGDMGVSMDVYSGGQPSAGNGARVGSTRHDHGNSADVTFRKDGRMLDWNNESDLSVLSDIIAQAKASGVTGIGAGDDYMGPGRFHVGFGEPSVWGAGGKSANAPEWLRNAYYGPAPINPAVAGINTVAPPVMRASAKPPGKPNFLQAALGGIKGGIGGLAMQAQPTVMRAAQRAAPTIMQAALGSVAGRTALIDPMIQRVFSNGSIMTPAKLASAQRAVSQSGDTSVGNQAEAAATRASAQSWRDSRR